MAKAVFLVGNAILGGKTLYATSAKINEDHKAKAVEYFAADLTPPEQVFASEDYQTVRFSLEGFLEADLTDTAYPTRGSILTSCQLNIAGTRYAGTVIIEDFTIDAVFDAAIRVTIQGVMYGITISTP